ncbi:phosphonate ABC transporter permease phne [Haloferax prahovense DSM 18310]|uniref:Phosphonate ABC transporter permease phne n=1 Tax=Haloferax prahovense (strain DSM 18310 / JCM 13924 / TL6) TaxID=1227461 RepID=M0GMK4_HALPT|nr:MULTISPECIES: phosphonate ABC transporter, permease protein PhnE [Haloferax]ELZ72782.1 phosphonate ABC transporter permease phne [Haloferax prahovense DSM 18310]
MNGGDAASDGGSRNGEDRPRDARTDGGTEARSGTLDRALRDLTLTKRIKWGMAFAISVVFGFFFFEALSEVGFSVAEILYYWPEFQEALGDFFPRTTLFGLPFVDFGSYWQFIQERDLFGAAIVTLAMGFAGTVLGIPGALLLGVLGSERVTPYPFNFIFRGTMSVIRAIPALVWALIYIPLGGVSPFTATLAIGTDTMGNLGRLFTDALEEVEDGPIEAIESTGANRRQTVVFGMLSQVFTPFIAWTMYILEINTRIAVTMGLIGGGGIGYVLQTQRSLFKYTNMMATILVIFVLVVSVEFVSQRVRSYIRGEEEEGMSVLKLVIEFPQRMARSIWE